MARCLFVGGVAAGRIIDIGDPPPAEYDLRHSPATALLPAHLRSVEAVYHRRDVAVDFTPGVPTRFLVYLAGPEAYGMGQPHLHDHVLRHVLMKLEEAGLARFPRDGDG